MKRCVITGAADGIGRALAHRFAVAGYAIVGIDVDANKANQTRAEMERQQRSISFIIANLTQAHDIERVLTILTAEPAVDVFIHNAGINAVGHFSTLDLASQRRVVDLNLRAPLLLTAGLLRQAKLRSGGSLLFMASLSHYVGYPGAAVYGATKDGLTAYARSLSVSLAGQAIHVLTVFPGPTRTAHARRYSPDNRREARRMPPDQLADQIFRAVQMRQRRLIPSFGHRLTALIGHYFPTLTERLMRKMIFDKLDPHRRLTHEEK